MSEMTIEQWAELSVSVEWQEFTPVSTPYRKASVEQLPQLEEVRELILREGTRGNFRRSGATYLRLDGEMWWIKATDSEHVYTIKGLKEVSR